MSGAEMTGDGIAEGAPAGLSSALTSPKSASAAAFQACGTVIVGTFTSTAGDAHPPWRNARMQPAATAAPRRARRPCMPRHVYLLRIAQRFMLRGWTGGGRAGVRGACSAPASRAAHAGAAAPCKGLPPVRNVDNYLEARTSEIASPPAGKGIGLVRKTTTSTPPPVCTVGRNAE